MTRVGETGGEFGKVWKASQQRTTTTCPTERLLESVTKASPGQHFAGLPKSYHFGGWPKCPHFGGPPKCPYFGGPPKPYQFGTKATFQNSAKLVIAQMQKASSFYGLGRHGLNLADHHCPTRSTSQFQNPSTLVAPFWWTHKSLPCWWHPAIPPGLFEKIRDKTLVFDAMQSRIYALEASLSFI